MSRSISAWTNGSSSHQGYADVLAQAVAATCANRWLLSRAVGRVDEPAPAGAGAAHLQDGVFFDLDVMRYIGRLGVEAASWQDLQLGAVEGLPVAGSEHARQDGDVTGIRMRVRRDLEAFGEFEAQRIRSGLRRIPD